MSTSDASTVPGSFNPLPGVVYPPADTLARYVAAGALTPETLGQALRYAFRHYADRIALVAEDRRMSYRELDELTDRCGSALLHLGLRPGDRLLIQMANVPEVVIACYGCFKAGIIPVCTILQHRELEIGYLADFTEARAHLVQGDLAGRDMVAFAKGIRSASASLRHLIVARAPAPSGTRAFEELVGAEAPDAARARLDALAINPFDVAAFQLSGGTTGAPKVIPRLHAEYLYAMRTYGKVSGYDESTVTLWPLPFMHNAALCCYNGPTHLAGGTVVLLQDLSPRSILGAVQAERVTRLGIVQPLLIRVLDSGLAPEYDVSSLQSCVSSARTELVEAAFGAPAFQLFGMSEGMLMRTRPEDPREARFQTVGFPISPFDEVRLLQPGSSAPVPEGEVGEFCARGPYTVRGYYKAEEHNRCAFTTDGFYRSGDLMRVLRIGGHCYYVFVGRLKDNINRGGEKIGADEVEGVIARHPAVRDVAVIGMPDREFGERVCAYLILEPDAPALSVETLGEFLADRGVAKFKWPERIEIVAAFPVTKLGKPSKQLLREDICQKLGLRDEPAPVPPAPGDT